MQPHRTFKYYFLKLKRLNGDPVFLARGIAIGLFIGVTPTIPLHTILILFFTVIFRGSRIAGLIASVLISNPLTFFIQYYLAWKIGSFFMPGELSWERINHVLVLITSDAGFTESLYAVGHLGIKATLLMLIGGILPAMPISIAGYFLSSNFFTRIQVRRQMKQNIEEQQP